MWEMKCEGGLGGGVGLGGDGRGSLFEIGSRNLVLFRCMVCT
jgi:hypothetical protein